MNNWCAVEAHRLRGERATASQKLLIAITGACCDFNSLNICRVVIVFFPAVKLPPWWGGPHNMEGHRYIFVIPPTVKCLPPKIEKPPTAKTYRHIALLPKNTGIFLFHRFRQKRTANSRHRQRRPPILNTAQKVPPTLDTTRKLQTLDTGQKVPPTVDIAQKVPPILDTARTVTRTLDTAQKTYLLLFSCSFFVLGSFWFIGFLFGKTSL